MTEPTKLNIIIDGVPTQVEPGTTIMQAADAIGIRIPRLCYHPDLSMAGACRVCIVAVEGQRNPVASCAFPIAEGMKVRRMKGARALPKGELGED